MTHSNNTNTNTSPSTRTLALSVVALTVLIATLAVPVSAAPTDSVGPIPIQGDTTAEGDEEENLSFDEIRSSVETFLESSRTAAAGAIDRIGYEAGAANPWGDGYDAAAEANESIVAINDNSDEIASYLDNNTLSSNIDSESDQIHEIRLVDDRTEETGTLYVEIDYDHDAGQIDSIEATDSLTGDLEPDEQHRVSGMLTENFASEIEIFVEEFALTDEEVADNPSYLSRLASQYSGLTVNYFESTLIDDDFDGFEDDDENGDE